ncbi:MAG: DUF3187 family protein [bacterium]|nr:DUF3187 family protein [bacterium]
MHRIRNHIIVSLSAIIICLVSSTMKAQAQVLLLPHLPVQPFQLMHPRPFGLELVAPEPGTWHLGLSYAYGNTQHTSELVATLHSVGFQTAQAFDPGIGELIADTWPFAHAYHIDLEVQALQFEAVRSFGDRWDVGVRVPWLIVGPTPIDGLPSWWHRSLGFPNGTRDFFPGSESTLFLSHDGHRITEIDLDVRGLGNVDIWLGRSFLLVGATSHRAWLTISAPTADLDGLGESAWRTGLRWAIAIPIGPTHLDAGIGWTSGGGHTPTGRAASAWHLWSSLTIPVSRRISLGIFARADSSPFRDDTDGQLGHTTAEFSLGASLRLGNATLLQLAVGEDFPGMGLNPDFSIQLRVVRIIPTGGSSQ